MGKKLKEEDEKRDASKIFLQRVGCILFFVFSMFGCLITFTCLIVYFVFILERTFKDVTGWSVVGQGIALAILPPLMGLVFGYVGLGFTFLMSCCCFCSCFWYKPRSWACEYFKWHKIKIFGINK
jgi:hypothetical protein